jgi:NAD(P)-dependent dehydrogenase (short-subunit alcohol dehydrogenase family)
MAFQFEGSVAVVTGAASGIGRACAIEFARQGSDVVVSDINEDGSKTVAAEIEALGRKALVVRTDVSKIGEINDLVDASIGWQGHCDLFMSNAGIGMGGAPHMVPQEEWDKIMDINLNSHIWTIRRLLPHMLERGSGYLVHTASSAGTIGFPSLIPYCVTKFGVVGLCESLAGYVQDRGIGVSVICPLLVATNIYERSTSYSEEGDDPAREEQAQQMIRDFFKNNGLAPERLAEDVVAAVNGNHLYVFPHPELKGMIEQKWADPDEWVRNQSNAWRMQREMTQQLTSSN